MLSQEERREIYNILGARSIDDGYEILFDINTLLAEHPSLLKDPLLCAYAASKLSPDFPWADNLDYVGADHFASEAFELTVFFYEQSAKLRYDTQILKNLSIFYALRPEFASLQKLIRSLCFLIKPQGQDHESTDYAFDHDADLYKFCEIVEFGINNLDEDKKRFYLLLLSEISPPRLGNGFDATNWPGLERLDRLVREFLRKDPRARWEMLTQEFPVDEKI
jgi:hypothetical protein